MERIFFYSFFGLGLVFQLLYRIKYFRVARKSDFPFRKMNFVDIIIVLWSVLGFYIIPVLHIATPVFEPLNFQLPLAVAVIFSMFYPAGVFLFYKSHSDLRKYWWMGYEISLDKELVSEGVYAWIRHPMYAGLFLIAVGTVFILQNWIAGFSSLIGFVPLYFFHIPAEDRHLAKHFGDAFSHYRTYTGKLFPGRRRPGR